MKTRFTTIDLRAAISQLRERLLGLRVANVYDIDNRTYLIKLAKPDMKAFILLESGNRIYQTEFDWPKNMSPSGFSMKMRKHLRARRLESIEQLGIDRIVDMQFGSGEAAYHIILELYDRGNIVLTDYEYTILNILRPRTDDSQDVRFAVREKYPVDAAKQAEGIIAQERLMSILLAAKEGDSLKKTLTPHLEYGAALIEHSLHHAQIPPSARIGKDFNVAEDMPKLRSALEEGERVLNNTLNGNCKGYIIQKREKKPASKDAEPGELLTFTDFHPYLYKQHEKQPHVEFDNFNKAVDEFFSKVESQRLDVKALQQEKQALKKLDNVKRDHEKRLDQLQQVQQADKVKAQLIEINLPLVDKAILVIKSALANQIDWTEIHNIVKEAQAQGDPVAGSIKSLKLETNQITMLLRDPFVDSEDEADESIDCLRPMKIDIDLGVGAYANARRYYDMKRTAATKEQKTIDASSKAMKSAEKKTKQTLKEVQTTTAINKTRKTYWFEKFLWFVSSENYLVIGGRDQQQNELIVKRYLRPGDLYVHADLHGASSVIVKNHTSGAVPPKTLNEAGTMAICNSAAWDAKVVTSAWWVRHDQVSKTAPTGEYLTTGSFMIRGKKNYLPPSYLIYGFGILFKLDEESIFRHKDERRVRGVDEDAMSVADSTVTEDDVVDEEGSDSGSDDDSGSPRSGLEDIKEEVNQADDKLGKMNIAAAAGADADDDENEEGVSGDENTEEADAKEEEVSLFPDTNIELQHVKGDKFMLQRTRTTSQISQGSAEDEDENIVYLGDDKPIPLAPCAEKPAVAGAKVSAKQRREMKKMAKQTKLQDLSEQDDNQVEVDLKVEDITEEEESKPKPGKGKKSQTQPQQPEAQQPKRGQKAKLKKMKEKYKDQDDEERQLRMEILASAGAPKEEKKKKGRKGRLQEKEERKERARQEAQARQATNKQTGPKRGPRGPLTLDDITKESAVMEGTAVVDEKAEDDAGSDDEKQAILQEENVQIQEDIGVLDTLTGTPVTEDTLLNSVHVCAPYSALVTYKYKVKMLPGSTKRGKAAKIAMNMFLHEKTASQREKDLFKSLKDVDISRNVPGKVKLSAPNLHKSKHK